MKFTALLLILVGTALAQNQPVQTHAKWLLHESHDEIHGDRLSFVLPTTETPMRSLIDREVKHAVYMSVICGKDGGVEVAAIHFNIPLHIDHTYIGDGGSELYTDIRYREGDEVASRLAVISDEGSGVFTQSAEMFRPFIGRAIEVEDIYGHLHVFHFPAASLDPLEGGCKNYLKEVDDIGQEAICDVLRDEYSDKMRELAIGADKEDGGEKYRTKFNNDLKKDAAQKPKCGLSAIKPIPLD